jgi:hypothetical protein
MLLAGLATQNKIGLLVIAGIFVGFALVCSFVISRRNPDFPGEKGIGVFAIVCVVLFAAQLTSILVFDKEKKEDKPAKAIPAHVQALTLQSHAQHASK